MAISLLACGPESGPEVEEFPEVCDTRGPVRLVETYPGARVDAMRVGDRYVVHEGVPYEAAPERLTAVDGCGDASVDLTPSVAWSYDPVVVIGEWLVGCGRPARLLDASGDRDPIELFPDAGCAHPTLSGNTIPTTSGGISGIGLMDGAPPRRQLWHHPAPEDPSVSGSVVFEQDLDDEIVVPPATCYNASGCSYLRRPPEPTHAFAWVDDDSEVVAVDAKTGSIGRSVGDLESAGPLSDPRYVALRGARSETYYDLRESSLLELATGVVIPVGTLQNGRIADIYPWVVGRVGAEPSGDLMAFHVETRVTGSMAAGPGTVAMAALSDHAILLGNDRLALFWPAEGRVEEIPEAGKGFEAVNVDDGVLVSTQHETSAELELWFVRTDASEIRRVAADVDSYFAARRNGVAVFIDPRDAETASGALTAVELDGTSHVIAEGVDWFRLVGEGNAEVLFGVGEGDRVGVWRSSLP